MEIIKFSLAIVIIIIIIIMHHVVINSQPKKFSMDKEFRLQEIQGITISGAGTRGYAILGVLEELVESGLNLNNVNYFVGTSAGAMISALVACRTPIQQIEDFMMNTNVENLFLKRKDSIKEKISRKSILDGSPLQIEYEKFLKRVTGVDNITFKQIYDIYGTTVVCVSVNIKNLNNAVYFSKYTYPDMPVSLAVRASSTIPILFDAVKYDNMVLVDGGCLDFLPIKELQKYVPLNKILGICLDTDIKYKEKKWQKMIHYTGLTWKMLRRRLERNRLTIEELSRTIVISFHDKTKINSSPMNFKLPMELKKLIKEMGVLSTRKFLHGSEFHV